MANVPITDSAFLLTYYLIFRTAHTLRLLRCLACSGFSVVIVAHALIDQREVKTALSHETQANTHNRANAVSRQRRHEHRVLPQGTNAVEAHHQGHNHCRGKTHIAPKEAKDRKSTRLNSSHVA